MYFYYIGVTMKYKVGKFKFELMNNTNIDFDSLFYKFKNDEQVNYRIRITFNEIYNNYDDVVFLDDRLIVYKAKDECLEVRRYFHPIYKYPMATTKIYDTYSETCFHCILEDSNESNHLYMMCLALDKIIYLQDCFVLHSSSILVNGKMILFSAPSGTGKSTQADLWNKYRNSLIVNGDRNLVYFNDGKFYAQGWVLSGSSEHKHNISAPIQSIVILEKNLNNEVIQLRGREAFHRVYREIISNQWDSNFIGKEFDFISNLLDNIPIILLKCTKDEDAVICLEDFLYSLEC